MEIDKKEFSILDKINLPKDIRNLNYIEKDKLAEEIRQLIIQTVSKTGGHLASNLGVTELTIALHCVYNTPEDKIIWDVGHQTYVHKILTGRKDKISTLRQLNGIAGFPKTEESEYDVFNTGHSSTSISAALGMARARDIKGEKNKIIAVIGDGALTGGMAQEALNDAGTSKTNVIVILNDNEMSISKNVGGVSVFLSKLRTKKFYTTTNIRIKQITLKVPVMGKVLVEATRRIKRSVKQIFISKMYFEDIGFTYLGPVDGHNIEVLENIMKKANDVKGPILIHVITKKGKGYKIAEDNPDKYHSTSSFDVETGKSLKQNKKDYSKVFGNKLVELAQKDKKIVAITAAMTDGTGMTEFKNQFPNRFFDVGIAEQHALCCAAGMATNGLKPVISLYSSFYQRGYDQIIHDIALQKLPVVMCVDRAGIVGNDGETHQGLLDMAMFNLVPNLTIMAPKDFIELEQMLEFAVNLNAPVIIRYPRGSEGKIKFKSHKNIELGKAEKICIPELNDEENSNQMKSNRNSNKQFKNKMVLDNGLTSEDLNNKKLSIGKSYQPKVTIIAIGKMVEKAIKIAQNLNNGSNQMCNNKAEVLENQYAEIINVRFLKPIDEQTIIESIKKTRNVITIEDGILRGGLATTVAEVIQKNHINNVKVKNYGYDDVFVQHGTVEELEKLNKLDF